MDTLSPGLSIKVNDVKIGEKPTVEINAKKSFSGNVYVKVVGYTLPQKVSVKNGYGKLTLSKALPEGKYTVKAVYYGSLFYRAEVKTTSFNVNRMDPALSIDVPDVNIGEKATGIISCDKDLNGYVTVYLKGSSAYQKILIKNGYGKVTFNGLSSGEYIAAVKFNGDKKFAPGEASTTFKVGREDPALDIHVEDVKKGENAVAKISANKHFSGEVSVYVKGSPLAHKVFVRNGYAKVSLGVFTPGEHRATVKYAGDKKFAPSEASTTFNVGREDAALRIDVNDINVGEKATAEISANKHFSGYVAVYVSGNHIPQKVLVKNGHGKATFNNLAAGKYSATVKFNGDDKFAPGETSTIFNVKRIDPALSIDVKDVAAGQKAVADITAKKSFTGYVSVYLSGNHMPQKVLVKNGHAKVSLGVLAPGEHRATVKYVGDDKFAPYETSTIFNVKRFDPALSIDVKDINVGEKATAEITAKKSFSGYVAVYVSGNHMPQKVLVKNGYGKTTFSGLSAGKYSATVKFNGDDKFAPYETSTVFNVKKIDPALSIDVKNIKVGQKAVADITAKKSFSGYVSVYVSGNPMPQKVLVKNGHGKATFNNLAAGKYSATVKFNGDKKFAPGETSTVFKVNRHDSSLRIDVDDITYGEKATAVITAKKSFSGYVGVYVSGNPIPQKVFVKNGHAKVSLGYLNPGVQRATVKFIGDDKFNPVETSTIFHVKKADPALSINVEDINVGDKATVEITGNKVFSGYVSVYLKGNPIPQKVLVKNGYGKTTFEGLAAGEYSATVKFIGDKKFTPYETSTIFNVNKINPNFSIKVDNVTEGQKAVAVINANETLNGEANVKLNNSNAVYPVTIVNGFGTVTLSDDTAPGDYLATVTFNGDDTFNADESSVSFTIAKAPEPVDPKLSIKVKNISYGEKATVSIGTDAGFSGNVGVDIGGKHIEVKVVNGKGSAQVSGLAAGTYTAKATFKQTDKYKASTKSTKFTVKKVNVKLTAKAKTFKYFQKTKNYAVTLKDNKGKALKGEKVTLKVNGKTYSAKTNAKGVATFKLTKLSKVGTKNAVISYAGDKTFNKASKNAKITVKFDTVSQGSKNKLFVKKIQKALKKHHFYIRYNGHHLLVDGWFFKYTKWAVKKFQKAHHLKVTGKVDYRTALKLKII